MIADHYPNQLFLLLSFQSIMAPADTFQTLLGLFSPFSVFYFDLMAYVDAELSNRMDSNPNHSIRQALYLTIYYYFQERGMHLTLEQLGIFEELVRNHWIMRVQLSQLQG